MVVGGGGPVVAGAVDDGTKVVRGAAEVVAGVVVPGVVVPGATKVVVATDPTDPSPAVTTSGSWKGPVTS